MDLEQINLQKMAVFTVDETGRTELARFQDQNRIIDWKVGEVVRNGKREPAIWLTYMKGLDPFVEQKGDGYVRSTESSTETGSSQVDRKRKRIKQVG